MFTDRARRVVVLAQEEARLLQHNYIGSEHLLLGMFHEGEGVAAASLFHFGLDLTKIRMAVEKRVAATGTPSGHIPFTPRAKKVLELSRQEALQLGHNYISTEHILLGLIREGTGVGAHVLIEDLGLDLSDIRRDVIAIITNETGWKYTDADRQQIDRLLPSPPPPEPTFAVRLTAEEIRDFLEWRGKQSDLFGPWTKRHPLNRIRDAILQISLQQGATPMGSESTTGPDEATEEPGTNDPTGPAEDPASEPEAAPEAAPEESASEDPAAE